MHFCSWFLLGLLCGDLEGTVIDVHDGDTMTLRTADGQEMKLRLLMIDAPEINQPYGVEARDFVRGLCLNKPVKVRTEATDEYGRVLSEVFVDGKSVNRELARNGWAWWFWHYDKDRSVGELELDAKLQRKGLFADNTPIYPRNWRRGARVVRETTGKQPVFIMAVLPNPEGSDDGTETVTLANRTSKPVDLKGWKLADDDKGSFTLSGTIAAGESKTFRLDKGLLLGNNGDECSWSIQGVPPCIRCGGRRRRAVSS